MGSRLRNQYDELNVLERVFDDIMMFESEDPDQNQEGRYFYCRTNDELLNENDFLEYIERHPEHIADCSDVGVAMDDMCHRWTAVSSKLEQHHWQVSAALMASAAADHDTSHQIAVAQELVRQNFRDIRQQIDRREESMLAQVEEECRNKMQEHAQNLDGSEQHLEKVERCRELGNRMCQQIKPMMLPFCNKLLFSKAQHLLEKSITLPGQSSGAFRIVPDSLNEHQALLEQLSSIYKIEIIPDEPELEVLHELEQEEHDIHDE